MSKPGDLRAGYYVATATVESTRRNLWLMMPGKERHIGTPVGGSRSRISRFDADCELLVRALAHYEAAGSVPGDPAGGDDRDGRR